MAEVLVLGAGMAGVGAALALQARGYAVVILDRREPGEETSFGNSGVIQAEAMEPYAMPRDAATLWSYAVGASNDVAWRLRDLPYAAPALLGYFRASSPARHASASAAYSKLIAAVKGDHAPLIEAAGAGGLIRRTGLGEIYRHGPSLDAARARAEATAARYGLKVLTLDSTALREADPAIRGKISGAVVWEDSWSTSDPGGLTKAYARLFESRGGRIVTGDAATLSQSGAGWRATAADGAVGAEHVVVALGPWSGDLLGRLGYRVRMLLKRGYHTHLDMDGTLSRPYVDTRDGVVVTSMAQGLRVTTGAEIVRPDRPADGRQLRRGVAAAAELVGARPKGAPVWFGHRPCMPDMLPVVGPAPTHKGLWLHFGHGHQGFTLGPTTGRLLAARIDGEAPPELAPLDPAGRIGRA